jgi:glycosyltransferase involved in cell wall biosynthesis
MMAHAKIVISTAVNAIPNYIMHNVNGFLIENTTEAEIISQGINFIKKIIEHPELKIELGKRSREIAIEKFSLQKFCRQYRDALQVDE